MDIAIIGSGYVGLVTAACFAEIGHTVVCIDNDLEKIAALQRGDTPIHEKFLPELLSRHRGQRLNFTASLKDAVRQSSIIFVAVGTPSKANGEADTSFLESACRHIVTEMKGFKLLVLKSTVPVGTNQRLRRLLQHRVNNSQRFQLAANPEFLREGTAVTDFLYPDRIVLGCDCECSAKSLQQLYQPLLEGTYAQSAEAIPIPDGARLPGRAIVTSTASAELIKQASNAFLAMKVSFINAVASLCEANGGDVEEVAEGIGGDPRIGSQFLKPGIGYGGSCFPKDLTALRAVAQESGYAFGMLDEVIRINEDQRGRFLHKVHQALGPLKGKRLGVLGLAFKAGTDDVRESPALEIVRALLEEGCEVVAHDPAAAERARAELPPDASIRFVEDAYEVASNAHGLLLLTDWEDFATLDLDRLRELLREPIVIDGRNLYSREQMERAGFWYYSVGRQDVVPASQAAANRQDAA
jgi:UDPglucose 6-dehydrogenase